MRTLVFLSLIALAPTLASAQQYMTREGYVRFFSTTPVEDIEAVNEQTTALFTAEGQFAFRVPILGFRFDKALMEEHFNENYMESTTYPNGTFEGKVNDFKASMNDGEWHAVTASGTLDVHGVKVEREIPSRLKWNGTGWEIESNFQISPAVHEIEIPKLVAGKIAENIDVTVRATLNPR